MRLYYQSHLLQMRGLKRSREQYLKSRVESHLLQMRGLKHFSLDRKHHGHKVASFTDAWIETLNIEGTSARQTSHLLQMRGLKPDETSNLLTVIPSHLLQMRGLKLNSRMHVEGRAFVASFTDAWIETAEAVELIDCLKSHLLQMRGLKHVKNEIVQIKFGRIFYRCVD